jgi:hypothetical protein
MTQTANLLQGGLVLSATIDHGQVVIFDLPARRAGLPGTVTAEQAATMTDQDWRRLARSRRQALRRRQRRAGMTPSRRRTGDQLMSPELRRRTGDWRGEHVDVFVGGHFVASYELPALPWGATLRERVLAAKALPIDFTPQRVVPTRRTGESRILLG